MSINLVEVETWPELPVPDVYFSYEYHRASASLEGEGAKPALIEAWGPDGVLRLPLLLRPIAGGLLDSTSCYGYGGPWIEGEVDLDDVKLAIDEWAINRGVVCSFLRLHPLLGNRAIAAEMFEVVDLNKTVAWPITSGIDLLAGMKKKHRQYARKAERDGLTATVVTKPADLGDFVELYSHSMVRLGADDFYHFPPVYWDALVSMKGVETLLVNVVRGHQLVAALLCLADDVRLHAHLLGANEVGRESKANYLAYVSAAEWGQATGRTVFHLGGGYGGDGGDLLAWKHGFCPRSDLGQFSIAKAVHDPRRYRELAGRPSTEGFFPPWRQ